MEGLIVTSVNYTPVLKMDQSINSFLKWDKFCSDSVNLQILFAYYFVFVGTVIAEEHRKTEEAEQFECW